MRLSKRREAVRKFVLLLLPVLLARLLRWLLQRFNGA